MDGAAALSSSKKVGMLPRVVRIEKSMIEREIMPEKKVTCPPEDKEL